MCLARKCCAQAILFSNGVKLRKRKLGSVTSNWHATHALSNCACMQMSVEILRCLYELRCTCLRRPSSLAAESCQATHSMFCGELVGHTPQDGQGSPVCTARRFNSSCKSAHKSLRRYSRSIFEFLPSPRLLFFSEVCTRNHTWNHKG